MPSTLSSRRLLPMAALTSAAAALTASTAFVALAPSAQAAATGAYSGTGTADLVHANAIDVPGTFNLADLVVGPASNKVSTASSPRATSFATNLDANLISGTIDENLIVEASQSAPPDNAQGVHDELLTVPADPLLTATVTSADAHSRWAGDDSCITNGPITYSKSTVADAVVLPGTPATVALENDADPTGAVVSETSTRLVKPAGATNYAVRSSSSTQITSASLFDGALVIEVITAPKVVVTAGGTAGTSSVQVTQPVLKVNGTTVIAGEDLAPINIPAGPVVELSIGNVTADPVGNGTNVHAKGNLLTLKVLSVPGSFEGVTLTLGDVEARATAPVGGVVCPGASDDPLRDARKDASAASVNAGQTFDYTVTVPNRGNKDLTNVTVKDTVSGSPALELVSATPEPTSSSGSTYTFSLGTITPNQVKTIRMTFRVPEGVKTGTDYSNRAVITATYDGDTVTKTVETPYPSVDGPGSGPCDLSRSTKFASHLEVFTGENFTYYVNVFNQGGKDCTGVEVTDELPSGTEFVSCTAGCTRSGQSITWDLGTVKAGASQQLAVTVKTTATSGNLPNEADVTPDDGTAGHPSTDGPDVTGTSVLAPSEPATRALSGGKDLASTGLPGTVAVLGLALLGLGLVARRRQLV